MTQAPASIFKIPTESPQLARGPASRARKATAAKPKAASLAASRVVGGSGRALPAGQELVQDGTDSVGGLASASAVPGGPAGQAARDDVPLLARVPVRQPQPQDASDELRPRQVPQALGRACLKV